MRLATLLLLFTLAACAPRLAPSTPADWAELADVLSAEEYAETFIDELEDRLEDADLDLTEDQYDAVYDALYIGAEGQRALLLRYRDVGPERHAEAAQALENAGAQTDATVEALLTPSQIPIYRALQTEARAALAGEVSGT